MGSHLLLVFKKAYIIERLIRLIFIRYIKKKKIRIRLIVGVDEYALTQSYAHRTD